LAAYRLDLSNYHRQILSLLFTSRKKVTLSVQYMINIKSRRPHRAITWPNSQFNYWPFGVL